MFHFITTLLTDTTYNTTTCTHSNNTTTTTGTADTQTTHIDTTTKPTLHYIVEYFSVPLSLISLDSLLYIIIAQ